MPELPISSTSPGSAEAADADALDPPVALALRARARRPARAMARGGAQHVLALEQARDAGAPDRERAQDEGAVRDRLVAGHAAAAAERPRAPRDQRRRGGVLRLWTWGRI